MDPVAATGQAEDERATPRPVQLGVDHGPVLVAHDGAGLEAAGPGQEGQGAPGFLVVEHRPERLGTAVEARAAAYFGCSGRAAVQGILPGGVAAVAGAWAVRRLG